MPSPGAARAGACWAEPGGTEVVGAGLDEPGALPLSRHPGSALWTSPCRRQHLRGFPDEASGLAPSQLKSLANRLFYLPCPPPGRRTPLLFLQVKASQAAGRPPGREAAGTQAVCNPAGSFPLWKDGSRTAREWPGLGPPFFPGPGADGVPCAVIPVQLLGRDGFDHRLQRRMAGGSETWS